VEPVDYRPKILERALLTVVAWLVRALAATLRIQLEGKDIISETLASGSSVLVFGWHELLLVAICDLRHDHPIIMVSRSRDGERIARVAERVGIRVVRGSSSRGGARALLEMVRAMREPTLAGHLIDGPRGPRHEVKPGLVVMAQRSRAALVPMTYWVAHKWTARSWDRFQVPLPFSRVVGRFLPARCLPADLDEAAIAALCRELGDELTRAYAQLESEHASQPAPANCRTAEG
jgi:lysophospholipid acyltransferase (LPLAT)-like uncharacterized protein